MADVDLQQRVQCSRHREMRFERVGPAMGQAPQCSVVGIGVGSPPSCGRRKEQPNDHLGPFPSYRLRAIPAQPASSSMAIAGI